MCVCVRARLPGCVCVCLPVWTPSPEPGQAPICTWQWPLLFTAGELEPGSEVRQASLWHSEGRAGAPRWRSARALCFAGYCARWAHGSLEQRACLCCCGAPRLPQVQEGPLVPRSPTHARHNPVTCCHDPAEASGGCQCVRLGGPFCCLLKGGVSQRGFRMWEGQGDRSAHQPSPESRPGGPPPARPPWASQLLKCRDHAARPPGCVILTRS